MTKLRIDLAKLADECEGCLNDDDARGLLFRAAEVLRHMDAVMQSVPEIIQKNREASSLTTTLAIADVLDSAANKFEQGEFPVSTAQGALRMTAASLREGVAATQRKDTPPKKRLILQ